MSESSSSPPAIKKGNSSAVHPCVVCPWHKYKISLKTGEGIYVQSDPFNPGAAKQVKSRGRKQRTHVIYEDDNTKRVMVQLNLSTDTKFESDHYASEEFKEHVARRKG